MACVVCDEDIDKGVNAGENKRVQFHYSCLAFVVDGMLDDPKTRKALRVGVKYARDHVPWSDMEDWEGGDERKEFLIE